MSKRRKCTPAVRREVLAKSEMEGAVNAEFPWLRGRWGRRECPKMRGACARCVAWSEAHPGHKEERRANCCEDEQTKNESAWQLNDASQEGPAGRSHRRLELLGADRVVDVEVELVVAGKVGDEDGMAAEGEDLRIEREVEEVVDDETSLPTGDLRTVTAKENRQ